MNVVLMTNSRTRKQWAEIINADWRKSIESIIQTGRDLEQAKSELPLGEWGAMIKQDLPFSKTMVAALRRIARHPVISNVHHSAHIPQSWTVLRELSSLSESDFEDAQEKGLITGSTNKWSATAVARAYKEPDAGRPIGAGRKLSTLPSPSDARKIARETNRFVAASDGNVYSGATEEEGEDHAAKRAMLYRIIDGIEHIDSLDADPFELVAQSADHWFARMEISKLQYAAEYLTTLVEAVKERQGVVDAQ